MRLALILAVVLSAGCRPSQEALTSDEEITAAAEAVAREQFQSPFDLVLNKTRTHALVVQERGGRDTGRWRSLRFLVIDVAAAAVVHQDSVRQGAVRWAGPDVVEVLEVPGIIRGDGSDSRPRGYLFDVTDGRRKERPAGRTPRE